MISHPDFPGGSDGKASAYSAGDLGSIPGLGNSHGEGNGNPFQYSCLENPMDRGAWRATVHGIARVRHNLETNPPPNRFTDLTVVTASWTHTCENLSSYTFKM